MLPKPWQETRKHDLRSAAWSSSGMKDYEIIATLGPASDAETVWQAMISAGATAFRLNTSHLDLHEISLRVERICSFISSVDPNIGLVLDLQGSKWRLGNFSPVFLEEGACIEFSCRASSQKNAVLPVPHPDFFQAVALSNGTIVLDDARISLEPESIGAESVAARVIRGGEISPKKGITCPSSPYRIESLNENDLEIFASTRDLDVIRYALSYVRDASEMGTYRKIFGSEAYLIAKLERESSVGDAAAIARFADELWLCRGDLGAELGEAEMAKVCHSFPVRDLEPGVPVLLAGQVFEHMKVSPVATRSEVCCLHDALVKGFHGVVLSDETAIGRYPVKSCQKAAIFRNGKP